MYVAPATEEKKEENSEQNTVQVEIVDKREEPPTPEDTVKDSWDAESSENEEDGMFFLAN